MNSKAPCEVITTISLSQLQDIIAAHLYAMSQVDDSFDIEKIKLGGLEGLYHHADKIPLSYTLVNKNQKEQEVTLKSFKI